MANPSVFLLTFFLISQLGTCFAAAAAAFVLGTISEVSACVACVEKDYHNYVVFKNGTWLCQDVEDQKISHDIPADQIFTFVSSRRQNVCKLGELTPGPSPSPGFKNSFPEDWEQSLVTVLILSGGTAFILLIALCMVCYLNCIKLDGLGQQPEEPSVAFRNRKNTRCPHHQPTVSCIEFDPLNEEDEDRSDRCCSCEDRM